ncbi:MAG: RAMP superfamily CRISPR-associated protein [Candidatus Korarchaeum sp.]
MTAPVLEAIFISGVVKCEIEARSPLTIGSGGSPLDPLSPDIPLLRDSRGMPIIPGSTLKGFFRAWVERTLSSLKLNKWDMLVSDIFGTIEPEPCGSRLMFDDALAEEPCTIVGIREHVKLSPETMGVKHGPFIQEYVEPGAKFSCDISFRNLPPSFLSLLSPVIRQADAGIARLGRSKSRGYGRISISLSDVSMMLTWPSHMEKVSFKLALPNCNKEVDLDAEKKDKMILLRDSISGYNLECSVYEDLPPFLRAKVPWATVEGCLDPLLKGLEGW